MTLSPQSCCDLGCFGAVTIITRDLQVITGNILCPRDNGDGSTADPALLDAPAAAKHCGCDGKGPDFITVKLTAPLRKIPLDGGPATVQTLFVTDDVIRVNLAQVVTVGPVA